LTAEAEQPKPQGIFFLNRKESFTAPMILQGVNRESQLPGADIKMSPRPEILRVLHAAASLQVNTKLLKKRITRAIGPICQPEVQGEIILANPPSRSADAQPYMTYKLLRGIHKKWPRRLPLPPVHGGALIGGQGEYAITATGEGNIAKYIAREPRPYVYPETERRPFRRERNHSQGTQSQSPECDDFNTSKEPQIILNTRNRRVVVSDLPGPKHLPALGKIKLIPYDAIEAAEIREDLSSKFSDWMM
jgi:hypothetical protein